MCSFDGCSRPIRAKTLCKSHYQLQSRGVPLRPLKEIVTRVPGQHRLWVDEIKVKAGCVECGYNLHPAALDFDHLDPDTKLFTIATGMSRSWQSLMDEMAKCEIVCANCHRIRTVNRKLAISQIKANIRSTDNISEDNPRLERGSLGG